MEIIRRYAKLPQAPAFSRIPHTREEILKSPPLALLQTSYTFVGCLVRHIIWAAVCIMGHTPSSIFDHRLTELQRWFPYDASRQIGHLWGIWSLRTCARRFLFRLTDINCTHGFQGLVQSPGLTRCTFKFDTGVFHGPYQILGFWHLLCSKCSVSVC